MIFSLRIELAALIQGYEEENHAFREKLTRVEQEQLDKLQEITQSLRSLGHELVKLRREKLRESSRLAKSGDLIKELQAEKEGYNKAKGHIKSMESELNEAKGNVTRLQEKLKALEKQRDLMSKDSHRHAAMSKLEKEKEAAESRLCENGIFLSLDFAYKNSKYFRWLG